MSSNCRALAPDVEVLDQPLALHVLVHVDVAVGICPHGVGTVASPGVPRGEELLQVVLPLLLMVDAVPLYHMPNLITNAHIVSSFQCYAESGAANSSAVMMGGIPDSAIRLAAATATS